MNFYRPSSGVACMYKERFLKRVFERSESARDISSKFIHQLQPETKTLVRKLEWNLRRLYRKMCLYFLIKMRPNCSFSHTHTHTHTSGVARGVLVIVVGNGHGDTSSNPGRDRLHFHIALIPLVKVWIQLFFLQR